MTAPCWDELITTARREAQRPLSRGLAVRPTLIGFEGGEPTLYVRSRLAWNDGPGERDALAGALIALPALLGLPRLLVVSPGRLVDTTLDDPVLADALAEQAITVDAAERANDGEVTTSGYVLPYTLGDDGQPTWEVPIGLPDGGPWAGRLTQALQGELRLDERGRLGSGGLAYALSRQGAVIAVAPGWRSRYRFDQPLSPRQVRSVDRRRTASLARHPMTASNTT